MSGPSPEAVEMLFLEAIELSPDECAPSWTSNSPETPSCAAVDELLRFDAKALNAPDFLQSPAAAVRGTASRGKCPHVVRPLQHPPTARRRGHGNRL